MKNNIILDMTKNKINISEKCAKEINEIMQKYNCYFDVITTIAEGKIFNQVLIKEKKENIDGNNIRRRNTI